MKQIVFDLQKISQEQPANYLWELCGAPVQYEMPLLKAEFSVDYRLDGSVDWKKFSFNFDITDYAVSNQFTSMWIFTS